MSICHPKNETYGSRSRRFGKSVKPQSFTIRDSNPFSIVLCLLKKEKHARIFKLPILPKHLYVTIRQLQGKNKTSMNRMKSIDHRNIITKQTIGTVFTRLHAISIQNVQPVANVKKKVNDSEKHDHKHLPFLPGGPFHTLRCSVMNEN